MNGMQRLAQAEQDSLDLHRALTEAVRRIVAVNGFWMEACNDPPPLQACRAAHALRLTPVETSDLMAVLERTSRRGVTV
jgi:hypothetical protein